MVTALRPRQLHTIYWCVYLYGDVLGRVSRYFVSHLVYSYSFDVTPSWGSVSVSNGNVPSWLTYAIGSDVYTIPSQPRSLIGTTWFSPNGFADGTGALVFNSNHAVTLQNIFVAKSLTLRLIFSLPKLPDSRDTATIYDMVNQDGVDNIKITLGGDDNNNNTAATFTLYVFNGQNTCNINGAGNKQAGLNPNIRQPVDNSAPCGLVLPGLIRPGAWYDMVITLDSMGVASVFESGVLLARAPVFRHQHSRVFSNTYVGSSYKFFHLKWVSATFFQDGYWAFDNTVSNIWLAESGQTALLVRAVQMFNTSFADVAIRRWYDADQGVGMAQQTQLQRQR